MGKRDLDLGWLRLFEALGRHGNLTRVAEDLHLTQPAVSYQLRRIEEQLGTPLLKRLHRGVEFTRDGQILYDAVKESLERIDGAVRQIREPRKPTAIRIHTDFGFASYWLIPRISAFRLIEPDIEVHVIASQSLDIANSSDADLHIVFGQKGNFPKTARQLQIEEVMPVCAPSYLAKHGPFSEPRAIMRQTLIHLEGDSDLRWFSWQSWLKELGIQRNPASGDLSLNTYNLVLQAALAGEGVALGWMGLIDEFLRNGALVSAGQTLTRPDHGYWLSALEPDLPVIAKLTAWLIGESARAVD